MVTMDSRVGSYVVVIEQSRVLLVRGAVESFTTWTLPGGALELGETAEAAAVREVLEETGLDVELDRILGVSERYISVEERLSAGDRPLHLHHVFFRGHIIGGVLNPSSDGWNDLAAWVEISAVGNEDRMPEVDFALSLAGYRPAVER